MAWIESHQSLRDHRKTKRMARRLGIPRIYVVGHLHGVWWWALDNAPTGFVADDDLLSIAEAAEWEGDDAEFVETLIYSEFAERVEGGVVIHDWDDYAGKLLEQRQANADRQRRFRDKRRNTDVTHEKEDSNALRNAHVTVTNTVTSQLRNGATGPNPTGPNSTTKENGATAPRPRSPKKETPKEREYPGFQEMWGAFLKEIGAQPVTSAETGKWGNGIKQLLAAGQTFENVGRLVGHYHIRFGDIPCNPMAIANNLSVLLEEPKPANNSQPEPRPMTGDELRALRDERDKEWLKPMTRPSLRPIPTNGALSHPVSATSSREPLPRSEDT